MQNCREILKNWMVRRHGDVDHSLTNTKAIVLVQSNPWQYIVCMLSTHIHRVHTHIPLCTSVQGYKQQKGFIIAQALIKSTCRDFWKMVYERACGVIVMLSDLVENGEVG